MAPQTTRKPRYRIKFEPNQIQTLENSFQINAKPDQIQLNNIVTETGLPLKSVQVWFQNRRARARSVGEKVEVNWKWVNYNEEYSFEFNTNPRPPISTDNTQSKPIQHNITPVSQRPLAPSSVVPTVSYQNQLFAPFSSYLDDLGNEFIEIDEQ